ncbi:MAG: AAA family ATPase [Cyanobacteria bacterium P01_H01_bin.21]
MIESIHIKNYKSILDLSFDVGRINVLIGENGCGKSNILEALALAGAAEANKLDNEFLASRGIRVTSPSLMRSGFFQNKSRAIEINIKFPDQEKEKEYKLENDNQPYSKWTSNQPTLSMSERVALMSVLRNDDWKVVSTGGDFEDTRLTQERVDRAFKEVKQISKSRYLASMVIYSPEETALRNLHREGQIEPLGIHGEGLLKLLQVLSKDKSQFSWEVIRQSLQLLDWFERIHPLDSKINILEELQISLFDRFTGTKFDQRSANEGFLFVLFYAALMVSKETPKIFAIDNVDASLNPKLCTKIMADIAQLAKQFDKQCFLTTHNPAILDGLDLGDDEQRLFVVSRNRKGHTRIKRITVKSKPVSSTGEELKLSEAFLRGYLGGLPKNF